MSIRHADVHAVCYVYDHRGPILDLSAGGITITVTADESAAATSVDGLVRAVQQYTAALTAWRESQPGCACDRSPVTA